MLETLANRCATSRQHRYLLFALATLASVLFLGYYFGTFDQAIHIPFLKKYNNPALYPNDPFFEMRHVHYSYFWFPFIWLYRLGVLEISLFVLHLLVTYATFWGIWQLSMVLFNRPLAALLAVAGFSLPHLSFGGFTLIEFSLLNRTFVLPFLLMAITLYLQGRRVLAFLVLGVLYNLHVVSVNFVLAMLLFDNLLQMRRFGVRQLALGMLLFVLAATPVLLWRASSGQPVRGVDWEWFSLLARSYFQHLFYLFGPYPQVLVVTFGGIVTALIFQLARRAAPSVHDRSTINFVIAALLIVTVQFVTAYVYPATLLVQSQIVRAGVFVMIFAYLYFAHYLAQNYQRLPRPDVAILTAAMIFSPTPIILLVVWACMSLVRQPMLRRLTSVTALVAMFTVTLLATYQVRLWQPGITIFAENSPWADAQRWAQANTPLDAVFITPPQRWWWYDLEWRLLAERSTVVTLSELLEVAFEPAYTPRWRERFEVLAPGAAARLAGNALENNRITAEAFYSLSAEQLLAAGQRYGASYLVYEKPHSRNFPVVYENEGFVIYRLYAAPAASVRP